MNLFDYPTVKIDKKIRLIELFGGIGSQAMALRDIGADFDHYRLVEFDKYAVASYNAIHGTSFEPTDICTVHGADLGITDKDKYSYIMTYSFPCQDLSVAGKQRGMAKGSGTRSGLLWEVERVLKELPYGQLPDILLMENVPQVHADANIDDFNSWRSFLNERGYWSFVADLNARDFGIPQNRERCFMVSILSKDFIEFEFPNATELKTVMKDYLEQDVDEKYYINNEKADKLIDKLLNDGLLYDRKTVLLENLGTKLKKVTDVACCLRARDYKGMDNYSSNAVIEPLETKMPIDLSLDNPKGLNVCNCISARTDRGISNRKSEGSGVLELF